MELVLLTIGIIAGILITAGIGFYIGRKPLIKAERDLIDAKQALMLGTAKFQRESQDLVKAQEGLTKAEADIEKALSDFSALEIKSMKLVTDLEHANKDIERLNSDVLKLSELSADQADGITALKEINGGLNAELQAERDKVEAGQMTEVKLENLANKIVVNNVSKLNKESTDQLEKIVAPIKEKFKELGEAVNNSTIEFAKTSAQSLQQFESYAGETLGLVNAIRGKNQFQGQWGEHSLQLLLENSGLEKDVHFFLQGKDLGYRDEDGRNKKPDVVIELAGDRQIVIDAKVSIVPWERYFNEQDPELKANFLKGFVESVRGHIENLGSKNYCDLEGMNLQCPVILFLSNDDQVRVYRENDPDHREFLQKCRIKLMGPSVLSSFLSNVNAFLTVEKQDRNTLHIVNLAGNLYDNFANALTSMFEMREHQKNALDFNSRIIDELTVGPKSVLSRCNKMKTLGVKGKDTKDRDRAKKKFRDLELHLDGDSMKESPEMVLTDQSSGMEPATLN